MSCWWWGATHPSAGWTNKQTNSRVWRNIRKLEDQGEDKQVEEEEKGDEGPLRHLHHRFTSPCLLACVVQQIINFPYSNRITLERALYLFKS